MDQQEHDLVSSLDRIAHALAHVRSLLYLIVGLLALVNALVVAVGLVVAVD